MDTRSDPQALYGTRGGVGGSGSLLYALVILSAILCGFAYKLRTEGLLSCQADGYTSDRYLANCHAAGYGDYEHGAFWFDLEPLARKAAAQADAVFLGDSRLQFGLSTAAMRGRFEPKNTYYLLGFTYGENVVFTQKLLRDMGVRAKLYVFDIDFLSPNETVPAKELVSDRTAYFSAKLKSLSQSIHRPLCQTLSRLCGRRFAIFRSRHNGEYYVDAERSGAVLKPAPVVYDHDVNTETIASYTASGAAFLSQLPVDRDCIIMTVVPTVRSNAFVHTSSIETAEVVARALGVKLVAPTLDGLGTFDGSHLDPSSAERWSKALLEAADPQVRQCLARP